MRSQPRARRRRVSGIDSRLAKMESQRTNIIVGVVATVVVAGLLVASKFWLESGARTGAMIGRHRQEMMRRMSR